VTKRDRPTRSSSTARAPRFGLTAAGSACARDPAATAPTPSRSWPLRPANCGSGGCCSTASSSAWTRRASRTSRACARGCGPQTGKARLAAARSPATFLAFDVLHVDGCSTRELAYGERRTQLAELGLDGPSSLKHKHRRSESLVVTGWLPVSGKRGETLLLARVAADGSVGPVGSVALGYSGRLREEIQEALRGSELPPVRPRQRVRRVAPRLRVRVDFHGPASGPLRDPVLRDVIGPG
jgi:hypothetical protein